METEAVPDDKLTMTDSGLLGTLASYADYLAQSGLSELTVKNYVADLKHLASWAALNGGRPLVSMTGEEIQAYQLDLLIAKAHPPATVNRRLQAIRKFFRYALERGLVDEDPSLGIKLLPQSRSEGPRGLDGTEVESLLAAVRQGRSRLASRDYAIVQIMLQTGIRVGELTRLRLTDLELSEDSGLLRVTGEGSSGGREIPLNSSVRKAIKAYLGGRGESRSDHLFLSVKGEPLSVRSVQRLVGSYARAGGVEDVSTYTLRQTCGQQLLRDTGDLALVARLMGHRRLETAVKYILPRQEDPTEAAERSSLNVY
jgi:site-specific recombinase XerD